MPVVQFSEQWGKLDVREQGILYEQAVSKADSLLHLQKAKTGVAILGQPQASLKEDPKHQNPDMLLVGEQFAKASLVTELVILMGAGIDSKHFFKYLGRGQYPKFKNKSMIRANPPQNKYSNPGLLYWAQLRASARIHGFQLSSGTVNVIEFESFKSHLQNINEHIPHLSDSMQSKAAFFLNPPSVFTLEYTQKVLTFAYSCFDQIMDKLDRLSLIHI